MAVGLAAATALLSRDRGGPGLCFQYLGIPELDDRLETASMQEFVDTPAQENVLLVSFQEKLKKMEEIMRLILDSLYTTIGPIPTL